MGKISRGLSLMGQSYRVLMQDKELLLLPVLSCVAILAVASAGLVGTAIVPASRARTRPRNRNDGICVSQETTAERPRSQRP